MTDPEGVTPPPGGEEPGGEGGPGGEESGGEESGGEEPGGEGGPGGEEPGGEEPGGEEPGGEEPGGEEPGGEEPGGATGCTEKPGTVYEVVTPSWQNVFLGGGVQGTNALSLEASVEGSADGVMLSIYLQGGEVGGGLEEGIRPGTYPLQGTDLDQFACSICVFATGAASDWDAAGGTLTIEEIDLVEGGAFRMSLTGITLASLAPLENEPIPGCIVNVADTTIEGVLVGPPNY